MSTSHQQRDPYSTVSRGELIRQFVRQLQCDNATIFLGAGMSQACGIPTWGGLLKPVFQELAINIEEKGAFLKYDYYEIAEKYVQHRAARTSLDNLISQQIENHSTFSDNHRIITRLPLTKVWTSNFDKLIEKAYEKSGKKLQVIKRDFDFREALVEDVKLYKVHGCVSESEHMVITKSDLFEYRKKYEVMQKAFFTALAQDTFLFLGFSFEDLHFESIMGMIKSRYNRNVKQHYAVIKKPDGKPGDENQAEMFAFQLMLNNLLYNGIKVYVISNYLEISILLKDIEKMLIRQNIFISGSFDKDFHDKYVRDAIKFEYNNKSAWVPYGINPVEKPEEIKKTYYYVQIVAGLKRSLKKIFPFNESYPKMLETILHEIGRRITGEEMNLYTGYGEGVCDFVVEGASKEFFRANQNFHRLTDRIKVFPLPSGRNVDDIHNNIYYREALLGSCGVMLITRGSTFSSDYTSGTYEEYYIAKGLSNLLLGKQKSIVSTLNEIYDSSNEENLHEYLPLLHQCYRHQRDICMYQFLEITEMFSRILYEEWKLVIRSIDAYRERMTMLMDKFETTNDGLTEAIPDKWDSICQSIRLYVEERTKKFYHLFEMDITESIIQSNDSQDNQKELFTVTFDNNQDSISKLLNDIKELRSCIKSISSKMQETLEYSAAGIESVSTCEKARTICAVFSKLIQSDCKYYWITKQLEAFSRYEYQTVFKKESKEIKTPESFLKDLWDNIYSAKENLEQAGCANNNRNQWLSGKVLYEQIIYLLADNKRDTKNATDSARMDTSRLASSVINKYYDQEYVVTNPSLKIDESSTEDAESNLGVFNKINIVKIQFYKIILVLSDIIGGLQRVRADYETTEIENRINRNDMIRDSLITRTNSKEIPEEDNKSTYNDPFFYNPNKIGKYMDLQNRYIEYYKYHVEMMKAMIHIKKNLKGIIKNCKEQGEAKRPPEELRFLFFNIEKSLEAIMEKSKSLDGKKLLYSSKPFRSGTIILPLSTFGGMAKKIWKEERIRFDYLCSNLYNFDLATRKKLMQAYDNLEGIKFQRLEDDPNQEMNDLRFNEKKNRLLDSIFEIIKEFQNPPKSGLI